MSKEKIDYSKYWKTKAGDKVLIKDLEDSHLFNIINLFKDKEYRIPIHTSEIGDEAWHTLQAGCWLPVSTTHTHYRKIKHPGLPYLNEELKTRNLK